MRAKTSFARQRALVYIAFSVLALSLMFVFGILPTQRNLSSAIKDQASLEAEIKRQEIFQPVYKQLMERKDKDEPPSIIKNNEHDIIGNLQSVEDVSDELTAIAEQADLEQISFSPVPESLGEDSNLLLVNGSMQGPLQDFREFLLRLLGTRAYARMENLEIQGTDSLPRYTLTFWVSLEE